MLVVQVRTSCGHSEAETISITIRKVSFANSKSEGKVTVHLIHLTTGISKGSYLKFLTNLHFPVLRNNFIIHERTS